MPSPPPDELARSPLSPAEREHERLETRRQSVETIFRTAYSMHADLGGRADAKASMMISVNSLIVSVALAGVGPRLEAASWMFLPTSALLVACLASLIFAVLSARPRVPHRRITLDDVAAGRANVLFFGHAANLSEDDYIHAMEGLLTDADRIHHSLMRDLYAISGVLLRKYRLLRLAYNIFVTGIVLCVGLFIASFVRTLT